MGSWMAKWLANGNWQNIKKMTSKENLESDRMLILVMGHQGHAILCHMVVYSTTASPAVVQLGALSPGRGYGIYEYTL